MSEQLQNIITNLSQLGARRLAALVAVALLVMATIGYGAYVVNKPAHETLYIGLDRDDINRIAIVLGEAGIAYDIGSEGNSVSVEAGKSAQARMILAEKGLPSSSGAGYELFDNLGSLGLTSFMQQVTLVRALEGEVARSIQAINGIKAARVHIVMAEPSNFRRARNQPTASVIVRTSGADMTRTAAAIRNMVAAAVPGLSTDNVTVLDSSGQLLAAGSDPSVGSVNGSISAQQMLEGQIADKIYKTLMPYLGPDNFRASVQAVINTDQRQIEETIFDPESRVERSVQVVRSEDSSTETATSDPATVEQTLPEEAQGGGAGPQSAEKSERREETTNYELNSKRIATVSNGYTIERLSISVVVNTRRIGEIGGAGAQPSALEQRLEEIKGVVATAAGLDEARGDVVNVTAVEFLDMENLEAVAGGGMVDAFQRQIGTLINAIAFVVVGVLVTMLGIKPLISVLRNPPSLPPISANDNAVDDLFSGADAGIGLGDGAEALSEPQEWADADPLPVEPAIDPSALLRMESSPQERLEAIIDLDEERSAQILRRWAQKEVA